MEIYLLDQRMTYNKEFLSDFIGYPNCWELPRNSLGGVCLRVTNFILRNLRLELDIPMFGRWEPHKYV